MKNLALNRTLIEQSIEEYNPKLTFTYEFIGDKYVCKAALPDQPPAIINFFYREKTGKTTIQVQGTNEDLSLSIAKYVIEQCSVVCSNKPITLRNLKLEDFELLLEYLKDECNADVLISDIKNAKKYTIKGVQGDNAVLTYYDNGTFLMQGCPILLHSQIIEFLCDYLELNDIIQSQINLISTEIKSLSILEEMGGIMPLSFDYLDPMIKVLISPSIALKKLDIELDDYTFITAPALRGLEGYLNYLFASKGITIGRDGFAPFLTNDYHATVSDGTRSRIGCHKTCTAINQCYSLYKKQRHGLFHANGLLANTRILSNREEAVAIVDAILQKIEESDNLIRG